jgi:hypothetical protein
MTTEMERDGRAVADRIQLMAGRVTALGNLLIEEQISVTDQPIAIGNSAFRGAQRIDHVGDGPHSRDTAIYAAPAADGKVLQVHVGINEAGHDETISGVSHGYASVGSPYGKPRVPNLGDESIADENRLGVGGTADGGNSAR